MPLVKKRSQLQQVQHLIKFLLEQPTNMSTLAQELLLLRQLIQQEQRLLTQQWTSQSTMQNLPRMRRYRHLLLVNRLAGITQDTSLMTWLLQDKSEIDL